VPYNRARQVVENFRASIGLGAGYGRVNPFAGRVSADVSARRLGQVWSGGTKNWTPAQQLALASGVGYGEGGGSQFLGIRPLSVARSSEPESQRATLPTQTRANEGGGPEVEAPADRPILRRTFEGRSVSPGVSRRFFPQGPRGPLPSRGATRERVGGEVRE